MVKREAIIDILKRYISLLKEEGVMVNKAYLYGSYLTGTASDESDIDIMIVTEMESDDYLAGKIWKLTRNVNARIEPFLIGMNRFNNSDESPLVELVRKTGLEIVV